jgi:hypothetical protein
MSPEIVKLRCDVKAAGGAHVVLRIMFRIVHYGHVQSEIGSLRRDCIAPKRAGGSGS